MNETEQNTVVYPPNKPFGRKIELSKTPTMYEHLLFIDFNDNGESIVGSSSLNDTLWEGTLLYFDNDEYMQRPQFSRSYIGSTASDGKFLNEETIVLAEDTGILNILTATSDDKKITSINYFHETDSIPKLAVWKNTSRILTCSGNNVSIWDLNSDTRNATYLFRNYHTELVTYVETLKQEPNIFFSASMDRKCCEWDDRKESRPATILYENEFSSLTAVSCNPNNPNHVAVSTEGGDIYLVDRREPGSFISVANCDFTIYRVVFDNSNKLAVCGDTNTVLVYKCDQDLTSLYCNEKHSGIVRGLAWHNDNLYSCGFDKHIVKHVF